MGHPLPFVIALAAGCLLTPAAIVLATRVGLVDRPGVVASADSGLKIHREPVPVLGGAAVLAATFVALSFAHPTPSPWLAAGAAVALGIGIADDATPLPPSVRVLALLIAAVALAAAGITIEPLGWLAVVGTIALVLATTNAVNIVDGQDGLAGGLAGVAALALAGAASVVGAEGAPTLGLALAGGLGAFLAWNRPPARIFLGNGGAYGVGLLLSALAVGLAMGDGWRGLFAAASCLGVFAFEVTSTVARRVASRSPLSVGDRDHAYDVLARRLGSRERSTSVMLALGLICGIVGLATAVLPRPLAPLGAALLCLASVPFARWLSPKGHDHG